MSCPPPLPDGWFGLKDHEPAALRLVKGSVAAPREAEPFPFWLAVVIATIALALGALGARLWILPNFFGTNDEFVAPVVDVSHAELWEEEKPRQVVHTARIELAPPFAPRVVQPVAIPAVQPEMVEAPAIRPTIEPYDPAEELAEAEVPFPTKPEPKVAKTTPKKTTPKSTRRPEDRPRSTPKPVAKGVSRAARVLRRYQPPYPKSARQAGTEGRVTLTVEVGPNGRVGSVRVSSSSGSAVLDSAAISAVKRWSFVPEQKNGKAVTATLRVPFRFTLK